MAVFMDGTWNEPNDRTNVYELYKTAQESTSQETYYVEGVGTRGRGLWSAVDKLMGGAFGVGLSANIRDGYRWLCRRYEQGDRIFLFGFSRGAYTARSLAGLIRNSGLVRDTSDEHIDQAYDLYRDSNHAPNSEGAKAFRARHAREVDIEFVGVWDTVGALGIPLKGVMFPGFSSFYQFHDTDLSSHTRNAFQALAANEYRSLYEPTLWTGIDRDPAKVEQRWFVGAHADVGGGYEDGILQDKPAQWIQQRAQALGMRFDPRVNLSDAYATAQPHDSYKEFRKAVPLAPVQREARKFASSALNMSLDASLRERLTGSEFLHDFPEFKAALLALPDGK